MVIYIIPFRRHVKFPFTSQYNHVVAKRKDYTSTGLNNCNTSQKLGLLLVFKLNLTIVGTTLRSKTLIRSLSKWNILMLDRKWLALSEPSIFFIRLLS